MARLGEFERIDRFFKPLAKGFPGAYELSDDAAAFAAPAGCDLVVTTDALVAGVHFLPGDPPADIARKLLRVNLSDLAAKGAQPFAYSLVTCLPSSVDESWIASFAAGLASDQQIFGIHLAGGDSVSTPGPLMLSVTAFGLVPQGRMIRRLSHRLEDPLFVTGSIGDAALGLRVLQGRLDVAGEHAAYLIDRYRIPRPRVDLAEGLRELARSALDVSDGLLADCGHLCEVSGVDAVITVDAVPFSPAARAAIAVDPGLIELLLTGGDDYEILFTADAENRARIQSLAAQSQVPIAEIGRMAGTGRSVTVRDALGSVVEISRRGWQHF